MSKAPEPGVSVSVILGMNVYVVRRNLDTCIATVIRAAASATGWLKGEGTHSALLLHNLDTNAWSLVELYESNGRALIRNVAVSASEGSEDVGGSGPFARGPGYFFIKMRGFIWTRQKEGCRVFGRSAVEAEKLMVQWVKDKGGEYSVLGGCICHRAQEYVRKCWGIYGDGP
eukprot:tig00020539_g10441.t1